MAAALPILALAATAVQTAGQIGQARSQSAAADFNQQQQQKNAQIALQQGVEDERMFRVQSYKQFGAEKAAYGASGVDSNSGSAADVLRSSAFEMERDAQKVKYGAQLKAQGYQTQAQLYGMESSSDSTGGYLSAAGTLLKGGAVAAYNAGGGGGGGSGYGAAFGGYGGNF